MGDLIIKCRKAKEETMFGNKKPTPKPTAEEKTNHRLEVMELQKKHELELKEKEFELKHFKDEEVKKLKGELADREKEVAVLTKENEMLQKITDLNADIIDIKDLVANLINKLPEIKVSNLSLGNGNSNTDK